MDSFFLPGKCSDPAYRNVRDGGEDWLLKGRDFTESLWQRFKPFVDSHFRTDAQAHFIERFWEMYLTVVFLERGFQVRPSSGVGPDFSFKANGHWVWVEAVAPGPGEGADHVPAPETGTVYGVPTEKILLRYANALVEKRKKYQEALERGIITAGEGYILAINSRRIPHAPYGNTLPYYLQALLPIGDLTFVLDRSTGKVKDRFYEVRESVLKNNKAPVNMRPFLDPGFAFVSAVLHSAVDPVRRLPQLGGDFSVLHNPMPSHPIEPSMFHWCDQYFYRDGTLEKRPANNSLEPPARAA